MSYFMYFYVSSVDFVYFYDFEVWFWKCSEVWYFLFCFFFVFYLFYFSFYSVPMCLQRAMTGEGAYRTSE
jgi:hypothetical protein